jgi:parallel beta-helix repeat protein
MDKPIIPPPGFKHSEVTFLTRKLTAGNAEPGISMCRNFIPAFAGMTWPYCKLIILVLGALLLAPANAAEMRLFVAPDGDDRSNGLKLSKTAAGEDGPVKSLAQAQKLVRGLLGRMKSGVLPRQAIHVVVAPGEYALTTALVFEPVDSGFSDAPVVYEAQQPGKAVLTGGIRLTIKNVDRNMVIFSAPEGQTSAIFGGSQLFVQGQRATLARMPDAGSYWFVEKAVSVPGEQGAPGRQAFIPEMAARDWLAAIPAAERGRAIVGIMSSWSAGRHRFADAAPPGSVRVKPAASWPFLNFVGQSQRFFVENVSTALDRPGEWFWAADEIRYIPRAGEHSGSLEAVLPLLDKLLEIRGEPSRNSWVENLRFKGLTFKHTRSLTPRDGFFDKQAAFLVGAAIEVDGARNVRFEACEVSAVGGYGLWFRRSVRDSSVVGSLFTDLGAGGVKLGLGDQSPADVNGTGHNALLGNTISETGKLYPGAVGVWVGQSFDNDISFNTIANTTYSGISVGWKWGYGETRSGRNKIIGNLLYNIGLGNLSDMGAIYHLGVAPGTIIADNLIREVRSYRGYGPGAWGIYLDEGSSNMVIRNNVVVGSDSGGLHLHYGRSDTVAGNVFAAGETGELLVTRSDPELTRLSFRDNLLLPASERIFGTFAAAPDVIFSGNRVSTSLAGRAIDLSACGAGCAASPAKLTLGPQPRAVAISGADETMIRMVSRVAAQAGRLPVDQQTIDGKAILIATAPAEISVATRRPLSPLAPVKDFVVDFDALARNDTRPLELNYSPKDDLRAIRLLEGPDIPGGACLLFDDGPQFSKRFDPHAFARVNFDSGSLVATFSVRVDPASVLIHEWRDDEKPYRTGPWLRISAKGIETHERLLTSLPPGPWLHLTVSAPLGERSGKWRLSISDGTGKPRVFDNLPVKSIGWKQLKWVGFISDAEVKSETCIGQIRVSWKNEPQSKSK